MIKRGNIVSKITMESVSRLFLIYFLLLSSLIVNAQQTKKIFSQYTIQDGLSHNTVNCIVQDSMGFMWFGTMDGLCRFDGNNFKVYKSIPNNPNSLCHNLIKSICLDQKGGLWIGTARGLSYLDIASNQFSNYYAQDSSQLSYNNIEMVFCDSSGEIWVGTQGGGLNKLDYATQQFSVYKADNTIGSLSNNNVHWIFEDKNGSIWVGTEGGGLNRLNTNNSEASFDYFQFEPEDGNYQALNCIRSIQQDFEGNIWVGTWGGGAGKLNKKKGEFQYFRQEKDRLNGVSDSRVISILATSNKELWLGTEDGGLNRFLFKDDSFENIKMERTSPFGLKSNNIRAIFEDRAQRIWLGTSGGGVFSFGLHKSTFSTIPIKDEKLAVVENQDVYAITGNEESLWIGTNGGGLYQSVLKNGPDTDQHLSKEAIFRNIELGNEIVHALSYDNWGRLWAGTLGGGLHLIEFLDNSEIPIITKFTINSPAHNSVSYNDIRSLYNDKQGNLWIGTAGGGLDKLIVAKRGEYYFEHYKHGARNSSISNNDIRAIVEDNSGNIWVGTAFGLNKLSKPESNKKFETFFSKPQTQGTLSANWINTLFVDEQGILWVGTDAGLNRLDIETNEIKVYTESDGLVNNVVKAISGDANGNLWITSVNGISMFSKNNGTFYNFYENDGLLSNEFNTNAVFYDTTGQIFIGGTQGVNSFTPHKVLQHNQINALHITDFKLFNQSVKVGEIIRGRKLLKRDISIQKELDLNYNENSFSFEFAALDYSNAEKITYQYKLEGFNPNWQEADAEHRFATYTNLGGGNYIFRVRAMTGVPGDEIPESTIKLHIDFPYWLRWWAFVLYISAIGTLVYFRRRYNKNKTKFDEDLRAAKMEREKERELNELKERFFMNVSHELKTPLTLILGPIEKIQLDNDMPKKYKPILTLVKRNTELLSRLITQMMDFSKQERGMLRLQAEKVDVIHFVRGIMYFFYEEANRKEISFELLTEYQNLFTWIDREKIEKVIFNLLSNAFKYTPNGGKIDLTILKEEATKELVIKVKDSGKGIKSSEHKQIFERFYQVNSDDSETGTGIGLSLVKEMVELHHGKVTVETQVGKGSQFIVKIPLGDEMFNNDNKTETTEQPLPTYQANKDAIVSIENHENQKPTVLIVEDSYDLCTYLQIILSEKYNVSIAQNGEEGLKKALEIVPDIIVSDVMMPKMDGITFCSSIKNNLLVSHVPVLLLTAKSGKNNMLTGFESGADDYVEKPFDNDILLARIQALMENRGRIWKQLQKKPIGKIRSKKINNLDRAFLEKLEKLVLQKMEGTEFSVEELGKQIGMSRTTLYRKVKGLTGKTAIEYVRVIRLNEALKMLQQNATDYTLVAEKVGFKDIDYFKKCFKKQFGQSPDLVN